MTDDEIRAWAAVETRRRTVEDRPAAEESDLGPLEWYDDEYSPPEMLVAFRPGADAAATGPRSQTVRGIICGSCAGWPNPPTSEEVYEALRAERPTPRQRNAVGVLVNEADFDELMNAHLEGAFTWRQLARAFKEHGALPGERTAFLKRLARPAGA